MAKAIVTFLKEATDDYIDVQIPTDLPVELLIPILVDSLSIPTSMAELVLFAKRPGEDWSEVPMQVSLEEAGVRDGAFLRIRQLQSDMIASDTLPVAGWKPLF